MITILGPTASGKTKIAVQVAHRIGGEIISADSRQVYRGMDIGTGKDLSEYDFDGKHIPYHLIDIKDPGYEYNIFEFRHNFTEAYRDIVTRGRIPVLCGGSGMYLDSVVSDYQLADAPDEDPRREQLQAMTDRELARLLRSLKRLHNKTDLEDRERMIKAILIAEKSNMDSSGVHSVNPGDFSGNIFGIAIPRALQIQRIEERLAYRLRNGMIAETERLLASGLSPERLIRYGLEYKFVTLYVTGQLSRTDLETRLNIAIRQFAKRQMTWFRGMERRGIRIQWIDGQKSPEELAGVILSLTGSSSQIDQ